MKKTINLLTLGLLSILFGAFTWGVEAKNDETNYVVFRDKDPWYVQAEVNGTVGAGQATWQTYSWYSYYLYSIPFEEQSVTSTFATGGIQAEVGYNWSEWWGYKSKSRFKWRSGLTVGIDGGSYVTRYERGDLTKMVTQLNYLYALQQAGRGNYIPILYHNLLYKQFADDYETSETRIQYSPGWNWHLMHGHRFDPYLGFFSGGTRSGVRVGVDNNLSKDSCLNLELQGIRYWTKNVYMDNGFALKVGYGNRF